MKFWAFFEPIAAGQGIWALMNFQNVLRPTQEKSAVLWSQNLLRVLEITKLGWASKTGVFWKVLEVANRKFERSASFEELA